MIKIARVVSILTCLVLPALAQASDPKEISWAMLAPPEAAIENPFASLTDGQMDVLRQILRLEAVAERSGDTEARSKARTLRKTLTKDGLNVDGLFAARLAIIEKREAATFAVNEELVGTNIRIPGYVLPLKFKDRQAVEFLLVPTVGACVHTPPPPANQIVHIVYPEGIEVNGLFMPVWVTGTMAGEKSVQTVGYVDGQTPVSVSYTMRPVLVEKYGG